ncbi:hypothetical protein ACHAWF_005875, partial [Thalassiosira exigua]
ATGLAEDLRVDEVRADGASLPVAPALAAVRRAAKSAADATSVLDAAGGGGGNPLLEGILSGVRDAVDALDRAAASSADGGERWGEEAPLYVAPRSAWEGASFPVDRGLDGNATSSQDSDDGGSAAQRSTRFPLPMDAYSQTRGTPLPGSRAFVEYALRHDAIYAFAEFGLGQLSGLSANDSDEAADANVSTETVRALFATDVELVRTGSAGASERADDRTTLLRGSGRVADLYRSLALVREASGGDWEVTKLEVDAEARRLTVRWRSESPLTVEGTDVFVFEEPSLASSSRLPIRVDGDKEEIAAMCRSYFSDELDRDVPLKVRRVENVQLRVAGVAADSAWAQSFVSAALRSGVAENAVPDATLAELLRSLTARKGPPAKKGGPKGRPRGDDAMDATPSEFPAMDDAAAAAFYGALRALHRDLANVAGTSSSSTTTTPAGECLADDVELRGLLGEVLARGSRNYRRLAGAAVSSLRAAVRANAVNLAAKPRPTVEVTAKGSIKVDFVLALWVTPNLPLGGAMGLPDGGAEQGFGVPLKIEVLSEYAIDNTGKIREHRILESRVNGVLTPGDVFSRWIKGWGKEEEGGFKSASSAMASLMDTIAWVRSVQGRK